METIQIVVNPTDIHLRIRTPSGYIRLYHRPNTDEDLRDIESIYYRLQRISSDQAGGVGRPNQPIENGL